MLKFSISINGGTEVEINEPVGFDKVDFNLTRSEELHSISSSFAGNSIEFEFNNKVHYNVFDNIISAYEVDGYLANVKLYVYWNNTAIFIGDFNFSTTQTDMVNYLKCQIVKKDKLYLLYKNKGIAIDLLGDKDLDDNTADIAPIVSVGLPPITLKKESIWEDKEVNSYVMTTGGTSSVFNNARNTTKYEINNTLSWLEQSQFNTVSLGRDFQLISAKENLKNITIIFNFETLSRIYKDGAGSSNIRVRYILHYGNEFPSQPDSVWVNNTNRTTLIDFTINTSSPSFNLPDVINYSIDYLPRGSGIWLFWLVEGVSLSETAIYSNFGTNISITADSENFYSVTDSIKYKDLVANAVKKISNINNVQWNVNYYDNTLSFNGNLIRHINDKGFTIKWQDIAKQLNERNLGAYYNESTDTLVIDHRNNILGSNNLGLFGDYAKKEFYFVTEDEKFIINSFKYKYSKYQALKENSVDGNYSSVHGESEWYIANKTFEGDISVDLPFVRDSFMIEDIRIKAINYKEDTATNEDSTVILIESLVNSPQLEVEETITVNTSFNTDDETQTIQNDGSFNWIRIGVTELTFVEINGQYYNVMSSDATQIILFRLLGNTQVLNGWNTLKITYILNTQYVARIDNGLLNQQFSIRQNIEYWRQTLNVANYYNKLPIINTLYKENKEASINGLIESSDIVPINAMHKPRVIETKVLITVDDYFYLSNNKIGFINIYNSKNKEIGIYLTELKALFLNGCDQMEANIKGWVKNEIPTPPIGFSVVVTRTTVDNVFYPSLNFVFNDVAERITIKDGSTILYSDLDYSQICSPIICFASYLDTKNYLLSL